MCASVTLKCKFHSSSDSRVESTAWQVVEGVDNKIDGGDKLKKFHAVARREGWGTGASVHMRLLEGSGALEKNPTGGFLQRGKITVVDALFGSVLDSVMAKNMYGQDTLSIIKGNSAGFPNLEILDRLANQNRGTTVVATAEVDGVKLMAIGFNFNHKTKANLFLATCGNSADGSEYFAKFQNTEECINQARLERPEVFGEFFDVSMACDNFNHFRQNILGIQGSFGFKSAWVKMTMELVGTFWTDLYFFDRAMKLGICDMTEWKCVHTYKRWTMRAVSICLSPVEPLDRSVPALHMYEKRSSPGNFASPDGNHADRRRVSCQSCAEKRKVDWNAAGRIKDGVEVQLCYFRPVSDTTWYCTLCEPKAASKAASSSGKQSVHAGVHHPTSSRKYKECWNKHMRAHHPEHTTASAASMERSAQRPRFD